MELGIAMIEYAQSKPLVDRKRWLRFVDSCLGWVTNPAFSFITGREQFRMEDLGQDFQAFDDARSRTVEILIAVRDKDPLSLHCLQRTPAAAALKQWHLLQCSRHVEAARVHEDE